MTPEQQKALREPFPKSAIGKLPKGGTYLDFVGHAATTARLLEVDPTWSWEPVSFDPRGLPGIDEHGGLWIRLTVAGVTRYGYGHAGGKKGPDAIKEAIGDAIRNAAMRFGVALDLWAKEDISTTTAAASAEGVVAETPGEAVSEGKPPASPGRRSAQAAYTPSPAQTRLMWAKLRATYGDDAALQRAHISDSLGREVESTKDLSMADVKRVIDSLPDLPEREAS